MLPNATFSVVEGRVEFFAVHAAPPLGLLAMYKIDSKEQHLGIRIDWGKQARLDSNPDPEIDAMIQTAIPRILEKVRLAREIIAALNTEELRLLKVLEGKVRRNEARNRLETILTALEGVREQRTDPINVEDNESYLTEQRNLGFAKA